MLAGKELAAWERKQAANRRAYDRERREKIGTRWHRYGLVVGYGWLALKLAITLAFVSAFVTVPWWIPAICAAGILANMAQHWNDY